MSEQIKFKTRNLTKQPLEAFNTVLAQKNVVKHFCSLQFVVHGSELQNFWVMQFVVHGSKLQNFWDLQFIVLGSELQKL